MIDTRFFEYVSRLLQQSGHMVTSTPVYINHNASDTLYIDSNKDVAISRFDRNLLMRINNVSRLVEITWPGVVAELTETVHIYSITIDAPDSSRSQIVADTHELLHQYWACNHSIVFFKNRNQYIISFADKDQSHILSDWFDIDLDYDKIVERIDVSGISIEDSDNYFGDFIYATARSYYLYPISVEEATYGLLPANFIASTVDAEMGFSKNDFKALVRRNLLTYELQYGNDYVAPVRIGIDEQAQFRRMAAELDRISFELELAAEIGDDVEEDLADDGLVEEFDEDFDDDLIDDWTNDMDPSIFDDPVLMVKWLEQHPKHLGGDNRYQGSTSRKQRTSGPDEQQHMEAALKAAEVLEQLRNAVALKRSAAGHLQLAAAQKRRDADKKRSYAERLAREQQTAEEHKEEAFFEAEYYKSELLSVARYFYEKKLRVAQQNRSEATRKRSEAAKKHAAALLKRSEAEQLARDYDIAKGRMHEKQLQAERYEREWLESENTYSLAVAYREQERLEAEQREQERIAEHQRRIAALEADHRKNLHEIEARRSEETREARAELSSIELRLHQIERRISSLGILQFMEKKALKAEQAELITRQSRIRSFCDEIEADCSQLLDEENQRYEKMKLDIGL